MQPTIYQIVKLLQLAKGNLEKQAILDQYSTDRVFKEFMRATYDPAINYYQKKLPDVSGWKSGNPGEFRKEDIEFIISEIAGRKVTGHQAIAVLGGYASALNTEGRELMSLIIKRSIGASVGDTMVLKTWPDLYFSVPYQRCSLMDDKAKERFGKLKRFYVQTKADGSFAYAVFRSDGTFDLITRQGSKYPQEFAQKICHEAPVGGVLVGELEVYKWNGDLWTLLDRKTGNGLLNSALKDGEFPDGHEVRMVAWDMLYEEEFVAGSSKRKYDDRFSNLKNYLSRQGAECVTVIPTWEVSSLKEAYDIYTRHTSRGLEGVIVKDPDGFWKNGTSKNDIKLKLKFEAEYLCTGMYEGEGKAKGMMGGANYTTQDYAMEFNCGTGFSDDQRKAFFADPSLIVGKVSMLSANDIIQSRDLRKKPALSLPVFEEVRFDKTIANTLSEVEAIVTAAKAGK